MLLVIMFVVLELLNKHFKHISPPFKRLYHSIAYVCGVMGLFDVVSCGLGYSSLI